MKCPKCKNESHVKNGIIKGLQRYKCKSCGFNYSVQYKSTATRDYTRRFALMLYLEGLGFHSIGRLLHVSHVSVINWIKKYGKQLEWIKNDKPVNIVELDELHTFLGSKKTTAGFGLQLIERQGNTLISLLGTEEQKQD
jgi:transposase-like protein